MSRERRAHSLDCPPSRGHPNPASNTLIATPVVESFHGELCALRAGVTGLLYRGAKQLVLRVPTGSCSGEARSVSPAVHSGARGTKSTHIRRDGGHGRLAPGTHESAVAEVGC